MMTLRWWSRALEWAVVAAALLTAFVPLYFARYMAQLYLTHGQTTMEALTAASGALSSVALYLLGALAYVRLPVLRPLLQAVAVVAAVGLLAQLPSVWAFAQPHNMFHNILASSIWEGFGRAGIAVLCIVHFVVGRVELRRASL